LLNLQRVELVGAYSNQVLQGQQLRNLRKQIEESPSIGRERWVRRQKAPRKLSCDEISALVRGYRDGRTVYELAAQFAIHRQTVSEVLKKSGVPRRVRPLSSCQIDKAVALRELGWTFARIGSELECDPSTVWRTLARVRNETNRN
jgi:hypothetical protein